MWQNPNPTAIFAPQNITLNSDDYDYLIFVYHYSVDYSRDMSAVVLKGDDVNLTSIWTNSSGFGVLARIGEWVSNTEYIFRDCYSSTGTKTPSITAELKNKSVIPYVVLGCKCGK